MLSVQSIYFAYGEVRTLQDVSLEVMDGQSICVIGPNGAGKTTLSRVICGILKPVSGRIIMDGRDIAGRAAHRVVREGIALVPEGRDLFYKQSVRVNLELGAFHLKRLSRAELKRQIDDIFEKFPRLRERQEQIAGFLSGGEQQMLAIGRALMARPTLIVLDEPSMGLSPILVEQIASIIAKLKSAGTSIILIEQNAHMALEITEGGYVLESGRVTVSGTSESLMRNPMVRHAYLGLDQESRRDAQQRRKEIGKMPSWLRVTKGPRS